MTTTTETTTAAVDAASINITHHRHLIHHIDTACDAWYDTHLTNVNGVDGDDESPLREHVFDTWHAAAVDNLDATLNRHAFGHTLYTVTVDNDIITISGPNAITSNEAWHLINLDHVATTVICDLFDRGDLFNDRDRHDFTTQWRTERCGACGHTHH